MDNQLKQALKKQLNKEDFEKVMEYHNGTNEVRSKLIVNPQFIKLIANKVAPITDAMYGDDDVDRDKLMDMMATEKFYEWEEETYGDDTPLSDTDRELWVAGYRFCADSLHTK